MDLKEIDCFFVAIAFAFGDAHRFVHKMCAHAVHWSERQSDRQKQTINIYMVFQ